MFALIENQQITKFYNSNKGVTIGDNQYPKSIFTLWSEAERNAIGIFKVTVDETNKKDEKWYINTNISYGVESNKAVGSYGIATPRPHEDILFTQQDSDDEILPSDKSVGDVKTEGLKTQLIRTIKEQAAGELQKTDWYITRKADAGTAVPSEITTHRAALEALYKYTRQEDGSTTRPLGELPILES